MNRILIKDTLIVTMEDKQKILKNGYILVENGLITEVNEGMYQGLLENVKVINGKGCAAIPGLINCHTHIPMTLLRGYGEGLSLMRWLNEKIWPFESKLNPRDIEAGALLGMIEMIKGGTTCFVDMYYQEEVIGRAAQRMGIRACLGSPIIGDAWESQLEDSVRLKEVFKDDPLITTMIAPHSPYTCSFEALKSAGEAARNSKMPVHIHIAETRDEINIVSNKYNASPVRFCYETCLFEDNRVIAAHCVHVSDEDMGLIASMSVTPVHNPQSNMKLASGISPIFKMLDMGISCALGTDGASSNNNLNMIDEMQSASLLQKLASGDPTILDGYDTLKMATVNGAKAVGMEESLGKIKSGYKGDIVLIDLMKPHMVPLHDIYSNIVFSAQAGDVKTVIINGRVVMEDRSLTNIDELDVISKIHDIVENIIKR